MADKKIHLKIITNAKVIFDGDVDSVYTKGVTGSFGILYNHVPFITALEIGVTKVDIDGEKKYFSTIGGTFQVKDNEAILLTPMAEAGEEIDVLRAKEAKERAEALLMSKDKSIDIPRAELALARAMARLSAAKKN